MEEKVLKLVLDYYNNKYNLITTNDLYVVWSCYILGNRKYLIATRLPDNKYFEVTYNQAKAEWYIDEYNKVNNVCIKN